MPLSYLTRSALPVALIALLTQVAACQDQAALDLVGEVETATAAPSLELTQAADGALDLVYTAGRDTVAPRMAEVIISPSGPLELTSWLPGDAAVAADKDVIVQHRPDGTLRVLVFSTENLTTLASGPLARLTVVPAPGTEDLRLTIQTDEPLLAPMAANERLLVGPALDVRRAR